MYDLDPRPLHLKINTLYALIIANSCTKLYICYKVGLYNTHKCLSTNGRTEWYEFSVLRPFRKYFTDIEAIVNQRWAKTGVPGEKTPDLPVQNLASHMYPERGSNHS